MEDCKKIDFFFSARRTFALAAALAGAAALVCGALSGCFGGSDRGGAGADKDRQLTFLFVPGVNDPFYTTMETGMRAKAEELGVELVVAPYPELWNPDVQIRVLEEQIAKVDPDALFISPVASDVLIEPLKRIHERGIQVVTVDTFIGDGDYSSPSDYSFPLTYVGSDNELGGRLMAEHLAELVGQKGKVFCQASNPDASSIAGRVKGFKEGIAQYPNIELVGVAWCLDDEAVAERQTLETLRRHPDLVGIFGVNVFSAQGSYRAILETGLTGAVKVASWDATPTLIGALERGEVDLVLAQKPAEMGELAVEWTAKSFREGVKVPKKAIPGFEFFTRDNVLDPAMRPFVYR
jgi:ribose transport system substrate-binding protein